MTVVVLALCVHLAFSHLLATLRLAAKPLCYLVCCVMSVNETSTRLELFSEHLSGGCFVDATVIDSEKIRNVNLRRDN